MDKIFQIAIDGPSGAGKSTIAKNLAELLKIDYIDTGAMYRAVGYKLKRDNIDMYDKEALAYLLDNTLIDFSKGNTLLDGEIVNDRIRTPEISMMASECSAIYEVRKKLVELQQNMGKEKSVVMDGRDIGTVVFPNAKYKFYINASDEERARRRYVELIEKGQDTTFEEVLNDMRQRDYNDTTREVTPLRKADDAIEIDTTNMSIAEVIEYILKEVKKWQQ